MFVNFWKWFGDSGSKEVIAIALEQIFKVNQRLEIMVDEYPTEQYSSRIEDASPDSMTIAMPMRKGYPVYMNRGGRFFGKVFSEGAVYQFQSFMLDKRMYPLPVWVVSLPTDIRKIQQRAFVRIDAMLQIFFKVSNDGNDNSSLISAATKDISGGGLKMISKQPLKLGTRLQLYIEIPESGAIETLAEVVRVDMPEENRDIYWIGLKYLNLPERDRSKIIKFVFKKQLEYRQKGL